MKITITREELNELTNYVADMENDPCKTCLSDKATCTGCENKTKYINKISEYENKDVAKLANEPHIVKYFELMQRAITDTNKIIKLQTDLKLTLGALVSVGSNINIENKDGSTNTINEVAKPNIPDKFMKEEGKLKNE